MGEVGAPRVFGLPQERERAVAVLNDCYGKNLLDLAELERRLDLVERATTLDALEAVLADVPQEHRTGTTTGSLSDHETVVCRMTSQRLSGRRLLTKTLEAQVSMGTLVLDYRDVALPPGVMEVRLDLDMSSCRIRLPEGVEIENRLELHMSNVRETPARGEKSTTVLRLVGSLRMSNLKVSRKGRFLGLFG